ncbi:MAG: transcriptional regulator, partial [Fervidicoccaceae archaeon]
MSETIPLKPLGKEDIRRLELALILGTLLREDVLEKIRNAEDRLTWLDSLIVAAGALARERANYTIEKISEELGRSESTVRNHLTGKTEAGKLVKETYENIKTKGGILELP